MLSDYDLLIRQKEYKDIANLLYNDIDCRKDNRNLIKRFYKTVYGISIDEAFDRDDVPNYQSIERMARKLKAVNHALRYDKTQEIDKYRQIAQEVPVMVRLF